MKESLLVWLAPTSLTFNRKEGYLALPFKNCAVAGGNQQVYDFLQVCVATGLAYFCAVGRAFRGEPFFDFGRSYAAFFNQSL